MVSRKLLTLLSATLLIAITGIAMADTIYRWIDAEGNPHFTRTPPLENMTYEEVEGNDVEPENPSQASETDKDKTLTTEEKYADQLSNLQKQKEQDCNKARQNKQSLLNKHRVRMKQADGSTKVLSHADKVKQLKIADESIKANCD